MSESLHICDACVDGPWIGWDYAHLGDYVAYPDIAETSLFGEMGHKWTVSEIRQECISVIEQLLKMEEIEV